MGEHTSRVTEIVQNQKDLNRSMKQLLRTYAKLSANLAHYPDFVATNTIVHHLEEGTSDFMKNFLREVGENIKFHADAAKEEKQSADVRFNSPTVVVTVGGGSGGKHPAACMMQGDPETIDALGRAALAMFDGAKGGGKKGKFQMKIPAGVLSEKKLERLKELAKETTVEAMSKDH